MEWEICVGFALCVELGKALSRDDVSLEAADLSFM
jgi:hypothetical protein